MGTLLRVTGMPPQAQCALKYCLATDAEHLDRFRREVRIMTEFVGNPLIVQIIDHDLNHFPPYFVMPIYSGDLRSLIPTLNRDFQRQEQIFTQMALCVGALHAAGKNHRDIKPANFLISGNALVVSDLGLGMDLHSRTGVTRTNQTGGTQGYIPPEFFKPGGFKNATAVSDIFMLGKSFYNLLTDLDPQFIDPTLIPAPVAYMIERCCHINPSDRYQSTTELIHGIKSAYDVVLGRIAPFGKCQAKYDVIVASVAQNQYNTKDISEFITLANSVQPKELFSIVSSADERFYIVLSQEPLRDHLRAYLELYNNAIHAEDYLDFSYAQYVANKMKIVFETSSDPNIRARALEIGIIHATRLNRYAAMSTCSDVITGIRNDDPATPAVIAMLHRQHNTFIRDIDAYTCKNPLIAQAIAALKSQQS